VIDNKEQLKLKSLALSHIILHFLLHLHFLEDVVVLAVVPLPLLHPLPLTGFGCRTLFFLPYSPRSMGKFEKRSEINGAM
jgi:hypothetical protein